MAKKKAVKRKAAKKTKKKFAKEFPKPVAWVNYSKAMEFAFRPGKGKWPEWPKGIAWERPCRLSNGDIYAGQWEAPPTDSFGRLIHNFQVFNHFEAFSLKDFKRDGYGDCEYLTGAIYSGEWKDDNKHGKGRIKYLNGDVYSGEWKDDNWDGPGRFEFLSGAVYSGEFKDGKRHGKGRYKYSNGDVYSGEWKDGKKHGQGRMKYSNGDVAIVLAGFSGREVLMTKTVNYSPEMVSKMVEMAPLNLEKAKKLAPILWTR